MTNWLEDFGCERDVPHLGLALAAITAFSHGDESAVDAVMADVADHPLEVFIAQTGLAATVIAVLASAIDESSDSLLRYIALMVARRGAASMDPFPRFEP
jgi:hypothetical protein